MNDIDLIKELDRLYLRAKETGDPDDLAAYWILRKIVDDRLGITRKDAAAA
jgi:hypothetical protein